MNDHIDHIHPGHNGQDDAINEVHRNEAEKGQKLLQNLSSVDQTPTLTFRNVIDSTDTFTMLNCIALILTYTAAFMEYSIPTSQIAFIIADLGKPELASWLSTASTCATAAILPGMSSFTDVFGRRYALLFGSVLGTAGALIAGFAPSTEIAILGQVRAIEQVQIETNEVCVRRYRGLEWVSRSSLQLLWRRWCLLLLE